jgi:hypothetical protein
VAGKIQVHIALNSFRVLLAAMLKPVVTFSRMRY